MGTRGAIGFRQGESDYILYNHSDSYPSELGLRMAQYVANEFAMHGTNTVPRLRAAVDEMIPIDPDQKPTRLQIAALKPYTDLTVSHRTTADWYCLLRGTQGDLRKTVEARYFEQNASFLLDGLFCEYAYILNLDTETMEFYVGFFESKIVDAPGRYWGRRDPAAAVDEKYGPVVLADDVPFKVLKDIRRHPALIKRLDKAKRTLQRKFKVDRS